MYTYTMYMYTLYRCRPTSHGTCVRRHVVQIATGVCYTCIVVTASALSPFRSVWNAGPVIGTRSVYSKWTMKPSQGQSVNWLVVQLPDSRPKFRLTYNCMYLSGLHFRTATVYRTLEPFWGEDYTLHVPNEFQDVSVHVYDYDLMG